jgi:peptide-methionine (S)-S-oxide reductase
MATQIATLAGGCFWCTEAIFRRLKGVESVIPGYTGGSVENPTYDMVTTGKTGHAEGIQIEFDAAIISYRKLLEIFFHLHDPTTLNSQGNDVGTQYRSAIFYHDKVQWKDAQQVKKELEDTHAFSSPIVTEVVPFKNFYPAEDYHKNYFEKNSYQPYCQYVIDPKLTKLLSEYRRDLKPEYLK